MQIYSIIWRNPYTEPPNDYPRKLWEGKKESGFLTAFFEIVGYGNGWCLSAAHVPDKPVIRWSKEAIAKNRKLRMKKRMQKKYPLFWEAYYEEELLENPDYYNGENQ